MNKYLITGVSGFVGQYFVAYLKEKEPGCQMMGVDLAPRCLMDISYQQQDLNNFKAVCSLINACKPDYIVHLASLSSVQQSWQDPMKCFQNNTSIMLHLLEALRLSSSSARLLSIGSSEEYGASAAPLSETALLCPINPYGVAKLSQEMLCRLYAKSMNLDIVMTRSFNHIGPKQNENFVVPSFLKQIVQIARGSENKLYVGNLDVARDFTDVRDVVDAYYKILHQGLKGEVYNVCSFKAQPLRKIITLAEEFLNLKVNLIPDPKRFRPNEEKLIYGDYSKLKKETGWTPKYSLEQTVCDMIKDLL